MHYAAPCVRSICVRVPVGALGLRSSCDRLTCGDVCRAAPPPPPIERLPARSDGRCSTTRSSTLRRWRCPGWRRRRSAPARWRAGSAPRTPCRRWTRRCQVAAQYGRTARRRRRRRVAVLCRTAKPGALCRRSSTESGRRQATRLPFRYTIRLPVAIVD
eukprot:2003369-Pyramimonas_sp.AAC.1